MEQREIESVAAGLLDTLQGELRLPGAIAERTRKEQPMLVRSLDGNPSYWLIPIASGDHLVGFLRLGLEGELLAYGRFGQGRQVHDFPPLSYLSEEAANREIRKAFSDTYEDISSPQLVHDGPVERITWLSTGRSVNRPGMLLFWTFGTSYSRPEGEEPGYGIL